MSKLFHIGDVLSITTGYLVSPSRIGGVYNILNYMTGDNLFTHQLPRASDECKPSLVALYPWSDCIEECKDLTKRLDGVENAERREQIVDGWVLEQADKYGLMILVHPLPDRKHLHIDPIKELEMMRGRKRLL